jgi:hypothetical protein
MLPVRSKRTEFGKSSFASFFSGRAARGVDCDMTALQVDIRVPVEDDAVKQAFDQLDVQMEAWLASMKRIEAQLQTKRSPCPSTPSVSEVPQLNEAKPSVPESQVAMTPVSLAPAGTVSAGEKLVPTDKPATLTVATPAEAAATVPDPSTEPPAAKPVESDDETLLAGLDEETAKAIRVMRRLSNDRRSIRDLLAEYRSKPPSKSAEQPAKSKSWWSRGK